MSESESTAFNIGPPGPGGDGIDKSQHVGHTLSFVAPVAETRDGVSGPYEVAVCSFVLCHTCRQAWVDLAVSGKALAPRITSAESEIVAVRLELGEAKAGRSAPYIPADATAAELELVNDDFNKYGVKMPSGKVHVDIDAFCDGAF
jgi:hypothetical protein